MQDLLSCTWGMEDYEMKPANSCAQLDPSRW